MRLILDLFKGFGIEYDTRTKVVTINKAISVPDFVYLKSLLDKTETEVSDIRVYADTRTKKWSKL